MSPKSVSRFWDNDMHEPKCSDEIAHSGFVGLAQPNRFKSMSPRLDSFRFRRYETADQSSAFQLPGREK
jgi:hypothetical protein